MKEQHITSGSFFGFWTSLILWTSLATTALAQSNNLTDKYLAGYETNTIAEMDVSVQLPSVVPFKSVGEKSTLIMLRPTEGDEQAEQGYCIKISLKYLSKESMDFNGRIAADDNESDFHRWYASRHPDLGVKKLAKIWWLRKDVLISDGRFLFVEGNLSVTKKADSDLVCMERIIDSIKPLR